VAFPLEFPYRPLYSIQGGCVGFSMRPVIGPVVLSGSKEVVVAGECEMDKPRSFEEKEIVCVYLLYYGDARGKSDRYVNPPTGAYCVLREERYHGVYLVAASDLKGKDDRTIRPVLVNIEVKGLRVAARDVLKYLFDMNVLNIESPYFPASLPWPLHQADRLCKKIYSISTYVHQIPSGSVLKLL